MRLSELYKCSINIVDGIKCFDLTDKTIDLKTQSSRRLIPVNTAILDNIENTLEEVRTMNLKYISKETNKLLTTDGESLYSLRHSFATELTNKQVQPELISELMGHTHSTMTLSRYSKGYDTAILFSAINKLTRSI